MAKLTSVFWSNLLLKFLYSFFYREYDPNKLWFLKEGDDSNLGQDALDTLSSSTLQSHQRQDELAIIKINNFVVKFESGVGNNTIPLLLLESTFSCNVKDWSSKRMNLIGSLDLEMAYYNSKLALWEPVIEPIITRYNPDGTVLRKRWGMNLTLQQNAKSDLGSAFVSPRYDLQ